MSMSQEELQMIADFKKECEQKYTITKFQSDYKPTFQVGEREVKPQIDAMFETNEGKTFLVEAYSTYAWKSSNWKDYQDRKVRNDALKLLAIIKLYKKQNPGQDVSGIIVLHHTTYKNFKNSNRNTVSYLKILGIEVEHVFSPTAVKALSRTSPEEIKKMLEYFKKQGEHLLQDIFGDSEQGESQNDSLIESEEYINLLKELQEDLIKK
ncbi:hypothetical protein CN326_22720 [Bacillus sp. AFS018417]|uniref:hypothetical protein n=1 Tax=Bacillus sp. AFS018417 TaxID=2033491 RepID=UPI000BF6E02E|nr:hypothetical protein [Bacillus sp. AFS018417]PEZ00302.1 hypothetical protein CN326_22720 [Bacillus sp. AFS018417]